MCSVQGADVASLESFVPALTALEGEGFHAITSRYHKQMTDSHVAARRGSATCAWCVAI